MATTRRDAGFPTRRLSSLARPLARSLAFVAVFSASGATSARAAAEDILVGAFDQITGVPVMGILLDIVRSGERTSQSPEVLDERLRAIEALVQQMDARLRLVEGKVSQLQNEVVKVANINRLRELQRARGQIEEILTELQTRPADPSQRAILEFRARQQADELKDSVDFDIWKWSDIGGDQLIRTRFRTFPAFELYAIAVTTWISALELKSGGQPQRIVSESGAALREHAAFLRVRDGWRELRTDVPADQREALTTPVTLREQLDTAAFCRLEAVDSFSNSSGDCTFAQVCLDTMADKRAETGRITLAMQPATAGVLCTWNPDQERDLPGEAELRASYGAEVMAALADALERLATSGSLRPPFVGQFPNFIDTPIFSVSTNAPLRAPRGAGLGTSPVVPRCLQLGGCTLGPGSSDAHWTVAGAFAGTGVVTIRNDANALCLDVKGSAPTSGAAVVLWSCNGSPTQQWNRRAVTNQRYTLSSGAGGLCATLLLPNPGPGRVAVESSGRLGLLQCDGREGQMFSGSDGTLVGPN